MSYKEDEEKHVAECKAADALWKVWQVTKKDEDKDKWWAALTGIKSKKYIRIHLTIWPGNEVDADRIKEMLENNGTNLPWNGENLYHDDQMIGEIMSARASVWPKPPLG